MDTSVIRDLLNKLNYSNDIKEEIIAYAIEMYENEYGHSKYVQAALDNITYIDIDVIKNSL